MFAGGPANITIEQAYDLQEVMKRLHDPANVEAALSGFWREMAENDFEIATSRFHD